MIKGLIFDLDGVITDTAKFHFQAWREIVKKIGVDFDESKNEKLKGLPRIATLKAIIALEKVKNISDETIFDLAASKNKLYLQKINDNLSTADVLPGIKKLLDDAKKINLKLAIASSSFNAPLILKKLQLLDYFDYVVNPQEITKGKPSPDIYLKASEKLGLNPEECIGFEDALSGVAGLKAAGIFTIGISEVRNELKKYADLVFKATADLNLEKLLDYFEK